ncbi:MAG: hemolysin III family protein [Desulfobacteraceae bacterium]|nr:hemolysin III family protein [Desulfobacteraceae bacterium]
MCACAKVFREPVNTISHLTGALGSIVALTLMVVFAAIRADAWHIVSFAIFGSTLILMYTASSLYHGLKISAKGLLVFRRLDHIMIFMLIAGSYTPVCLVPLRGPWGWSLFGTIWGIAIVGIIIKIFFMKVPRWVSTSIYLVMGWMCLVAIYPLIMALEWKSFFWLALGGLFYSTGAIVYALKKPNPFPKYLGFHEIWHFFVLSGSACHFWFCFNHVMYIS